MSTAPQVKTVEELKDQPEEYRQALEKIVISHAINELYGAQVFDEPAVAYAPTPYAKWLTCPWRWRSTAITSTSSSSAARWASPRRNPRQDVEEAALDLRIPAQEPGRVRRHQAAGRPRRDPAGRGPAAARSIPCATSRARPCRRSAAQFGLDFGAELVKTSEGKQRLQAAVNTVFPVMPAFFGRPKSRNNETYRKWGIKKRSNEKVRDDYMGRAREASGKLGLTLPAVAQEAA